MIMSEYKVHIINTGKVRIEPELAFGEDHCSTPKTAGFSIKKSPKISLPVNVFLLETLDKLILLDTGWDRSMSPTMRREDLRMKAKPLMISLILMESVAITW